MAYRKPQPAAEGGVAEEAAWHVVFHYDQEVDGPEKPLLRAHEARLRKEQVRLIRSGCYSCCAGAGAGTSTSLLRDIHNLVARARIAQRL